VVGKGKEVLLYLVNRSEMKPSRCKANTYGKKRKGPAAWKKEKEKGRHWRKMSFYTLARVISGPFEKTSRLL